uniref:USP8_dimer domain-containing protein n=1 Tax=Panagrellus redivivus TaxID=6233 RepID=A0A7E4ULH3_PANRE
MAETADADLPKAESSENTEPVALTKEKLAEIESHLSAILDNPPENVLDPIKRLCGLVDSSRPHTLSTRVPLKRFCDMLDDVYNMAQTYAEENTIDKAFVFYLRFLGIAVEELGKHADYVNLSEDDRLKFCKCTVMAINTAEELKRQIKKNFDLDALQYRVALEVKQQLQPEVEQKKEPSTPPLIFGNLKSYTTCDRQTSYNFLFQRIILPNNLPERFLSQAEKAPDGTPFGRLYGKLIRNSIIVSHIIMTNGDDEKLEKVEKIIPGTPTDDDEPSDLILIGGICHSLEDAPMQEFISLSLLTEIVCIIVPKEDKRCCVIHLSNLPHRRKNGPAFPADLLLGCSSSSSLSSPPTEAKEQKEEEPTTSSPSSSDKSDPNSPPVLHHRSMCKHVHITPTLNVIQMPSPQSTAEAAESEDTGPPPEKQPRLSK